MEGGVYRYGSANAAQLKDSDGWSEKPGNKGVEIWIRTFELTGVSDDDGTGGLQLCERVRGHYGDICVGSGYARSRATCRVEKEVGRTPVYM